MACRAVTSWQPLRLIFTSGCRGTTALQPNNKEGDQQGLEPCLRIEYLTTDSYPPPNNKKRMTTFWSPSSHYKVMKKRFTKTDN